MILSVIKSIELILCWIWKKEDQFTIAALVKLMPVTCAPNRKTVLTAYPAGCINYLGYFKFLSRVVAWLSP